LLAEGEAVWSTVGGLATRFTVSVGDPSSASGSTLSSDARTFVSNCVVARRFDAAGGGGGTFSVFAAGVAVVAVVAVVAFAEFVRFATFAGLGSTVGSGQGVVGLSVSAVALPAACAKT